MFDKILIFIVFFAPLHIIISPSLAQMKSRDYKLEINNIGTPKKVDLSIETSDKFQDQFDQEGIVNLTDLTSSSLSITLSTDLLELEKTRDAVFQKKVAVEFGGKGEDGTQFFVNQTRSLSTPDGQMSIPESKFELRLGQSQFRPFLSGQSQFLSKINSPMRSKKDIVTFKATAKTDQFDQLFSTDVEFILLPQF